MTLVMFRKFFALKGKAKIECLTRRNFCNEHIALSIVKILYAYSTYQIERIGVVFDETISLSNEFGTSAADNIALSVVTAFGLNDKAHCANSPRFKIQIKCLIIFFCFGR